LRKAAIELHNR